MLTDILPNILKLAACRFPEKGISFVNLDGSIDFLKFETLLQKAKQYMHAFQVAGMTQDDRVIISLDSNEERIIVIWACFLGGMVPALLQPPVSFSDYNPAAEKAKKVYNILKEPWVVLSHNHFHAWESSEIPPYRLIDLQTLELTDDEPLFPDILPDDLALVQFSSGSTGDPKGVMLTHRNIIVNLGDISKGLRLVPEDMTINWMPLFHDMGLFGFHLVPLSNGMSHTLIEPSDFVKNPALWLDSISRYGINITACPNFGQMIVNRYLSRKSGGSWDLSRLRVLFNGAEPISVPVMAEFTAGLEKFGFDRRAMFPAYGMAEATLAVTFPPLFSGAEVLRVKRNSLLKDGIVKEVADGEKDFIELVNLGQPLDHFKIKITDSKCIDLEEDHVGNVWILGESVTQGYINNPEMTENLLKGEWLFSGDLGFIHKGSFYITGRTKDIIFINATNYYAHDLESVAVRIPEVNYGKIVISGYFDEKEGHDEIVVFIVCPDNDSSREIFKKIRDLFNQTMGINVSKFVPIKSNDIPRTSSGKIQRYRLTERFIRNEFPVVIEL